MNSTIATNAPALSQWPSDQRSVVQNSTTETQPLASNIARLSSKLSNGVLGGIKPPSKKKPGDKSLNSVVAKSSLPKSVSIYRIETVHKSYTDSYQAGSYVVVDNSNSGNTNHHTMFGYVMHLSELEAGELELIFKNSVRPTLVLRQDVILSAIVKDSKVVMKNGQHSNELKKIKGKIVNTVH